VDIKMITCLDNSSEGRNLLCLNITYPRMVSRIPGCNVKHVGVGINILLLLLLLSLLGLKEIRLDWWQKIIMDEENLASSIKSYKEQVT